MRGDGGVGAGGGLPDTLRIHVDIGHPAHVHFFRQPLRQWASHGHRVRVTSRDKDVAIELLDAFGIEHRTLSRVGRGILGLGAELATRTARLRGELRRFDADVVTAIGGGFISLAGKAAGGWRRGAVPTVVFTDTEHVATDRILTQPWATWIATPEYFQRDLGSRHLRYRGMHELSYLAPGRFSPEAGVARAALRARGRSPDAPFAVVRFVAWGAGHDAGHGGFDPDHRRRLVERLARQCEVFITSEGELPDALEPYRLRLGAEKFHAFLAEAALSVGEGATVACEAALLGVPAIYVSSLVGTMGNLHRLEEARLVEGYKVPGDAVERAVELAADPSSKAKWGRRREEFLAEQVDVAAFATGLVERVARGLPVREWSRTFAL